MINFLKRLFTKSSNPEPAEILHEKVSEKLPDIQQEFSEDEYILFKDFYFDILLPNLREKSGIRGFNLVSGIGSSSMMSKLCDGESSFYYPRQLKHDGKGDILFTYDCYVPARSIVANAKSNILLSAAIGGLNNRQPPKNILESYLDAFKSMKAHTVAAKDIDKRAYSFHDAKDGPAPFYKSVVEKNMGFDFVMRPASE